MSNVISQLTRAQLAEFLPNARAVRVFEQLLEQVGILMPAEIQTLTRLIDEAYTEATIGTTKANQAVDALVSIAHSLQSLSLAPTVQQSSVFDYLDASTVAPIAVNRPGRIKWNDVDGTLEIGLKGGNVILQIGQEQNQYVKNNTATDFTNGQLVYITGAVSDRATIALAKADIEATSSGKIGLLTEDIPQTKFGFITTEGIVHNLNTSGFAAGDVLWLSAATAGAITNIKPVQPLRSIMIGYCIKSHATIGQILVSTQLGYKLDQLQNVLITTPATGNLLQYDGTGPYWKNVAASAIAEPPITAGTTTQYWRGDKTWQDFFTSVRSATLIGLSTATNAVITAADTVLTALGKLQKQISDNLTTLTTHTGSSAGVHGLTSTVVGTTETQTLTNKTLTSPVITGGSINNTPIGATTANTGKFTKLDYAQSVSANGLNIKESGTFNDALTHTFSGWGTACGVAFINSGGGITAIPWFPNGGDGIGYSFCILDPDAGTWTYGNTITFTSTGLNVNSYTVTIAAGSGRVEVTRTSGTSAYSIYIQILNGS